MLTLNEIKLLRASKNGDFSEVDFLLKKGVDVNIDEWDSEGEPIFGSKTALMLASENGYLDIVELILSYSPYLEGIDNSGGFMTALSLAVDNGHFDIAEALIEAGADVNFRHDEQNMTMLMRAVLKSNQDGYDFLIDNGADVNIVSDGENALQFSTYDEDSYFTHSLIRLGADINPKGIQSPLTVASYHGNVEIVQALLDVGAIVNPDAIYVWIPLRGAAINGNYSAAKLLIESGANVDISGKDGNTLFMEVVKNGRFDIAKLLIENGVDVTRRNDGGKVAFNMVKDAKKVSKTWYVFEKNKNITDGKDYKLDLVNGFLHIDGGCFDLEFSEVLNGEDWRPYV